MKTIRSKHGKIRYGSSRSKTSSAGCQVFISHKAADGSMIGGIRQKIQATGIRVFASSFEAGKQWRSRIYKELRASKFLLFFYTDTTVRYDWCFFETGFFDAVKKCTHDAGKTIVVLCAKGVPIPSPLQDLQAVEVEPQDRSENLALEALLRQILHHARDLDSLNSRDQMDALKGACLKPFQTGSTRVQPFGDRLKLKFEESAVRKLLAKGEIDSNVTASGALELFGFGRGTTTNWKSLTAHLESVSMTMPWPGSAVQWAAHLGKMLRLALNCVEESDWVPLYYSAASVQSERRVYRPLLLHVTHYSDGSKEFDLHFVLIPREAYPDIPGDLGPLWAMFDMIRAFRFGMLRDRHFEDLFRRGIVPRDKAERMEVFRRLDVATTNHRINLENRGITLSSFQNAFGPEGSEERATNEGIGRTLQDLRRKLTGALQTDNVEEAKRAAAEYMRMYALFIGAAWKRYQVLMQEFVDGERK
ncbi:MAG TPA: toll/interleukin-1 receptor domain-containing protein [Verrucomicrobiae bacterium]|nr:toll/interleukin-1 receptor domain-containing protein [Verrucomicrobiae bacterium]